MRLSRYGSVLLASAAYVVVGAGTAALAGMAASPAGVKTWRLIAWLLSLFIFGAQFAIERRRQQRPVSIAVRVALAVAVGALALAVLGPLRAHWGEPSRLKLALLSVVAWPALTGVPAFIVALLGAFLLDRSATDIRSAEAVTPNER